MTRCTSKKHLSPAGRKGVVFSFGARASVANVAKFLARFGRKVFAVDFDLEAPGLHYKFAPPEQEVVHSLLVAW